MKTLGPYKFIDRDADPETNCGCGTDDYCVLLQEGDRITFQIADALCQSFLQGCNELTATCIAEQGLTSAFTYTQNANSICFDLAVGSGPGEIEVDDYLFQGNFSSIARGQPHLICFSVSNNTVPDNQFALRINDGVNTWESAVNYMGNGYFCGQVDVTGAGIITVDWGIVYKGGNDAVRMCLEAMTLCISHEYSGALWKEGVFYDFIALTAGENGNVIADVGISDEITPGCYTVRFTAGEIVYESNCIKVATSHPCTLLLNWRNDNNAFGFDYSDPDYVNYLRIKGRLKHPVWPMEVGSYLQSNNQNQLTNAQASKTIKMVSGAANAQTAGEPEYVHESIATALIHNIFTVDGVNYRFTGTEYAPSWRKSSELAHFEVDLLNQDFDGINRYCS